MKIGNSVSELNIGHHMNEKRITRHPILDIPERKEVDFYWNDQKLAGFENEMISSALFANNIKIFGHHFKDHSPQGMYCANGQCSQCLVIADHVPVKSCMTPLKPNMKIKSVEGLPELPEDDKPVRTLDKPIKEVDVLIIGGGPAGLSAAIELGKLGIGTLIIDDKDRLGGKLVLQTHKFFGSVEDSHAGTRGYKIGEILENDLRDIPSVNVWLNTTAVGVFSDGIIGAVQDGKYRKIKPKKMLVATGAREKMLAFPGNTLPGVYGAGAFQTLVNRDLVRPSEKVLIVGGGNVGLIAGYHAIQAGIEVVALIEALPEVGGYKVHSDKLMRLGVPIFTRHTIVSANGSDKVESVTIAGLDEEWNIISGTHRTSQVDTILIAVGLSQVNEFYHKARDWGMDVYGAGDAREIAEASAAMFTGKIEGLKIAKSLNMFRGAIPREWDDKAKILKSKPGRPVFKDPQACEKGVMPIFHCYQEVPCNPCTSVCPENIIQTEDDKITGLPFMTETDQCQGCMACVAVCPGLAVTLVDYRKNADKPVVTIPYEMHRDSVEKGQKVSLTDTDGNPIGLYPIKRIIANKKKHPGTFLVQFEIDAEFAKKTIGIKVRKKSTESRIMDLPEVIPDDAHICRCERVTAGEIRKAIRSGVRDMNQLKSITRSGMGACGSKTCGPMVWRLFQEEGVDLKEITDRVDRPLFVEVPLGVLAGIDGGGKS